MSGPDCDTPVVGLLGARSPVGEAVAAQLADSARCLRFSRRPHERDALGPWWVLGQGQIGTVATVVSLVPVWALSEQHSHLEAMNCRRLVALSSTSRFTKQESARPSDRDLAERLRRGEAETLEWGRRLGVEVILLRPTMIYGHDQDGNVSTMRRVLQRFRAFPVVGPATGRRQPVHVDDVAWATVQAAMTVGSLPGPRSFTISGGEVLTYRAMVDRVRATVPGPTVVLRVPSALFRLAERLAPRSRTAHTAAGMADRMATDMTFDHQDATASFGYAPRAFDPTVRSNVS